MMDHDSYTLANRKQALRAIKASHHPEYITVFVVGHPPLRVQIKWVNGTVYECYLASRVDRVTNQIVYVDLSWRVDHGQVIFSKRI